MIVPSHPCWAGAVSKGACLICVSATSLHVKSEKSGWLISDPGWQFIYFLHILNEHMMMTHVNNPCFTSELGAGYCRSPQKWSVLSASHLFPTECQFPSHLRILELPFLFLPLPCSLPAFCRSSIFTSFLSPDTGPSWAIMFAQDLIGILRNTGTDTV